MTTLGNAAKVMAGATPAVAVYVGTQKVWPLAPEFNDATGGTVTEVPNYNGTGKKFRVHTFLASDPTGLVVAAAPQPFKALAVGGGGAGGRRHGPSGSSQGGAGGHPTEADLTLAPGSYPVVVGPGGPHNGPGTTSPGAGGGPSSIATLSAAGGEGGQPSAVPANGYPLTSNITGTATTYGGGGCTGCTHTNQNRHAPGTNGLGSGGGGSEGGQNHDNTMGCEGGSGVVIVAYEIA